MKHEWTLWVYPGSQGQPVMPDERRAVKELFTRFSQMLLKANLWDWQNNVADSGLLIQVLYHLETVPDVHEDVLTTALNRLSTAVLSVTLQQSQNLLPMLAETGEMMDAPSSPSTS